MLRIAVLAVALTLPFSALAQAPTPAQQAACRGDTDKFCKGVLPGGGRILNCLAKEKAKLSDACRKVVESQGR